MRHKFSEEIRVQGRWFEVKGDYYPGFPGNWDNPPEPPDVDFHSVTQFFDDNEEPWERDEMFIDEKPDIWLFVEYYQDEFIEKTLDKIQDVSYDEDDRY